MFDFGKKSKTPFGTKEKCRNFKGFGSYRKFSCEGLWNKRLNSYQFFETPKDCLVS
jgi:hypothetical protein